MSEAEEEAAGALARRGWGRLVGERPRRVSAALGFLAIDFENLGLCRHWGDGLSGWEGSLTTASRQADERHRRGPINRVCIFFSF